MLSATKNLIGRSSIIKTDFWNRFINIGIRSFLSEAYSCDDAWKNRLSKPPLKGIKMDQFFVELERKSQTKRLVSGVDVDMFANNITNEWQLEELEHILYKFRRTKRAAEMMESTHYATIRNYLQFKDYEALFRILPNRESYGVFPDFYCYNLLMDTFLKEENYRNAVDIAVLMMLQEEFSNSISRILGLYSCYQFLEKDSLENFWKRPETEAEEAVEEETAEEKKDDNEEDEDEETLIRIPYLRNPYFDDHFHIKEPKHLIGKTLYLIGRKEDNLLGRTSQVFGLCMYEKWDKAIKVLDDMTKSSASPLILEEGVKKCKEILSMISDENKEKDKIIENFENKFSALQNDGRISSDTIMSECEKELTRIPNEELLDIKEQNEHFSKWENERQIALAEQEKDIDKEQRLKIIAEKKEELYWKEKYLFFFENEEKVLEELEEVKKIIEKQASSKSAESSYVPPEMIKKKPLKLSELRRKALVKSIRSH